MSEEIDIATRIEFLWDRVSAVEDYLDSLDYKTKSKDKNRINYCFDCNAYINIRKVDENTGLIFISRPNLLTRNVKFLNINKLEKI